MVKADESWLFQQHSAWHSPNLNYTSKQLPPGQRNSFPSFMNPCTFSTNVAFPGFKTTQANGTHELSQNLPPLVQSSVSPRNPYPIESQYESPLGLGIKITPNDATASVQKRFLIFDQSGSQTRLFLSPFGCSSRNPFLAHAKPEVNPVLLDETQATVSFTRERSGENQVIGEESVMHEDTEEINALLYSDDDDENDDENEDGDEDDEVTSTGHSPCAIKGSHQKFEQWEITEEVASSDGSSKRQKLLDGGYEKSSLVEAKSSMKLDRSCKYNDDAASSCAMGSISGKKRLKKDKIEETLRIIQSIIPGSMSKDPLLIIDEAIDYLKSLKLKAQSQSSLF